MAKKRSAPPPDCRNLHTLLREVAAIVDRWNEADKEGSDPWFRGQANAEHSLLPGLYRPAYKEIDDEDDVRVDFELKAFPYLDRMQAGSHWQYYALMQHYGLPTRLLDWSESLFVAVHFAVAQANPKDKISGDAAVWMLDPFWLNTQTHRYGYLGYEDEDIVKRFLRPPNEDGHLPRAPLAICLPHTSPRITAQKGLFTVHGSNRRSLEDQVGPARLIKFVIPENAVRTVQRELRLAGVSWTGIFPELASLGKDLVSEWMDSREDSAPAPKKRPERLAVARRTSARGRRRK